MAPTTRAPTKPIKGLWRPDVDAPGPDDRPSSPPAPLSSLAPSSSPYRPQLAPDPHRKGGISFDDDDDLADYMHPDDVPAKNPEPPRDLASDRDPSDHDP